MNVLSGIEELKSLYDKLFKKMLFKLPIHWFPSENAKEYPKITYRIDAIQAIAK